MFSGLSAGLDIRSYLFSWLAAHFCVLDFSSPHSKWSLFAFAVFVPSGSTVGIILSHRDDSLFYSLNTPTGWEPVVPGRPPRAGGFPLPSQGCLWLACGAVGVVFSMPRERSRSMRQPARGHTAGWVSSPWLLLTLKCVFVFSHQISHL